MHQQSDWQLIQLCRKGNELAFQQIVKRYERLLFAIALRYGLLHDDAADVAQQTFTLMLTQIDTFHANSNLKGWFGTVARRQSWRLLNRYDYEQVETPENLMEIAEQLHLHFDADTNDVFVLDWLHTSLSQLGERCQKLLYALYFEAEEPSYDEIATMLAIAKGSIGPTRQRCLKKLRANLELERIGSAEI